MHLRVVIGTLPLLHHASISTVNTAAVKLLHALHTCEKRAVSCAVFVRACVEVCAQICSLGKSEQVIWCSRDGGLRVKPAQPCPISVEFQQSGGEAVGADVCQTLVLAKG
jgi:hypothetical protein